PCSMAWEFGDGAKATGAPVSHDYGTAANGKSYNVILVVTDELGVRTMSTAPITIYPASAHPYTNKFDQTWTFTQPGTPSSINVTFAGKTNVESGYDRIYVMDKSGKNITGSPFTGIALAGATLTVPGDTVTIRLTTDLSVVNWGFEVTKVVPPG